MPEAGSSRKPPLVGVLAMQGAFAEHIKALEAAGARTRLVRSREDLDGLDGIVLPGGESTTMTMLMERVGMLAPLRQAIERGLPTLATCAGMIVLAREITDGMADQKGLDLLDIAVRRNGYGRQVDSFEAPLQIDGLDGKTFPGVFIRAPLVERTGDVEVIARHDGHPVAVRHGRITALGFHPELSGDLRLHREFVRLAAGQR
ncbi:MAG: pyridoxal 5'-phosphate synthase glutaminase subunit PdxT [Chloroflexi bacterium]|nr:MAG: pyridoxal 5'-phosphate synthase glutaminase subunit PdxT [Chloroflexota bacterium]TMF96351.1 MAG: pyridoxal 5'-phosphate synthase glutaminase subunit PdxT [Chloroflexota bacterium]